MAKYQLPPNYKFGPIGGEILGDDGWTYLYSRGGYDYKYSGDSFIEKVKLERRSTKHVPYGPWFDVGKFDTLPDMYIHIKLEGL